MAYEFQTEAFRRLDRMMQEHPDGIPRRNASALWQLSKCYIDATEALFDLMLRIMQARLAGSERGGRYKKFLPIYSSRVELLIAELREFLFAPFENKSGGLQATADFLEAVRRGGIAEELVALQHAVDASSGKGGDAEADESAGTTVTNSLKTQIEERVKRKWIKDTLHAINEVLAITRGVA
ncbi:MAG: hypothetical protein RIE87_17360 [Rhodospirillales bacterium]